MSQFSRTTLAKIRSKLLDLTRRNRLLNYKESIRSIRIVDELPNETFKFLVSDEKNMELLPIHEKNEAQLKLIDLNSKRGNKSSPEDSKIDTNVELPFSNGKTAQKHKDTRLQTIFSDQVLERRCKKIRQESRTAIEETGCNVLHLAIGFLEWYENENSSEINRAPLILVPINIEKSRIDRETGCYKYIISYTGEDIETNLSLAEKLNLDFNRKLPSFNDDIIPEDYFKSVRNVISRLPRWKIAREMVIGLFSFSKLLMYKDLDNERWPKGKEIEKHSNIMKVLVGSEENGNDRDQSYDEEYSPDNDLIMSKIPSILDADSSQLSVISDTIFKRKDLVVEGPPGTGKSQTIANLIAAALHEGLSVLFVAEKKAALEVVRSRLDHAGLGDFCLELHSHKTQKGQLHADIAKRRNMRFPDTIHLDRDMEDLVAERNHLLAYSNLLNSKVGRNGETVYDIFWAVEKFMSNIKTKPIVHHTISGAIKMTRQQINEHVHLLQDIAKLKMELPDEAINEWSGLKLNNLLPGDEIEIAQYIANILGNIDRYIEFWKSETDSFPFKLTMDVIKHLSGVDITVLLSKPNIYCDAIAYNFIDKNNLHILNNLDSKIAEYKKWRDQAEPIVVALNKKSSIDCVQQIYNASFSLMSDGYSESIISDIIERMKYYEKAITIFQEIKIASDAIVNLMPTEPSYLSEYQRIVDIKEAIENFPGGIGEKIRPEYVLDSTKSAFSNAKNECETLVEQLNVHGQYFNLRYIPEFEKLDALVCGFRKYRGNFFPFLRSDYRNIKRDIKIFLNNSRFFKNKDFFNHIESLADTIKHIGIISRNEQYMSLWGPLFSGITSDWEKIDAYIQWGQKFSEIVGGQREAHALLCNIFNINEAYRMLSISAKKIKENIAALKAVQTHISINGNHRISECLSNLAQHKKKTELSLSVLQKYESLSALKIGEISGASNAFLKATEISEEVSINSDKWTSLLGAEYCGIDTDTKKVMVTAQWITQIVKASNLHSYVIDWLIREKSEERLNLLIKILKFNKDFIQEFNIFRTNMGSYCDGSQDWLFEDKNSRVEIDVIQRRAKQCLHYINYLPAYYDYCSGIEKAKELGLGIITELIENGHFDVEEITAIYNFTIYDSMARDIIIRNKALQSFTRASYENRRDRFAELDRKIIENFRKRIAHKTARREIPHGIGYGPVRDYSESALLDKELQKQKRHIPIRQLVKRASQALKAMKPCFMMSPMSVAQYLQPGEVSFDLVVMDEASQLKPEDALGSIARAKQLVIVGDPKQLPPTTFFDRTDDIEDDSDESAAIQDTKSILDICWLNYNKRRLRWHYRSEDESLIAFSNFEFYDGDLILFPTPKGKRDDYGVHRHYIENATYHKGRNRIEAEAIALGVIEHFKHTPTLSLGVATMNREQTDLILDIIEKKQKDQPFLEAKIKATESMTEPFFVKNLENVQGDERDVIFVSTTYGPDPETGRIFQRFGPIASEVGWRRLNVIFTRAKKRLDLFTSLHSTDILLSENSSRGTKSLKAYLEYAETGIVRDYGKQNSIGCREPDSDFEIGVCNILNEHGYRTAAQVGVAGFFIDIGVLHPERDGEFILGIECDGATYHSAKSVRDRDRLRQEILEKKGWHIHRIWSTDWFKNREKEVKRLIQLIQQIIRAESSIVTMPSSRNKELDDVISNFASSRSSSSASQSGDRVAKTAAIKKENEVSNGLTLKEELLQYQKSNILPNFPNTSDGILREEILERMVRLKPTTKEEFYKYIPIHLRQNTDAKQMQYLGDILEIIESYAS